MPSGLVPAHRPSVCRPDAPPAGNNSPRHPIPDPIKIVFQIFSNCSIVYSSTPAAPRFAFTRLYASHTSRLEIQNGFALSIGSSPYGLPIRLLTTTPLRSTPITALHHYYGRLRPCAPHRYSDSCGVRPLELLPSHRGDRFLRSSPSLDQGHAALMPDANWPVNRYPPTLSRDRIPDPGFDIVCYFRHVISGSLAFVS